MGWFADQIKQRKEQNQKTFEQSFKTLAGINDSIESASRDDFIISQLTKYFKYPDINLPQGLNTLSDKLDYTLKNVGVIAKKIELTGTWNLDYREPILVFTKDDNIPILMLPKGTRGHYSVSFTTGKKFRNTTAISKRLSKEAYVFYKPLPTHKLTFKECFKYFAKSVRVIDLAMVVIMSVLVTAISMLLPYISRTLTGEVVNNKDYVLYTTMTIFLVAAGTTYVLIRGLQGFIHTRVSIKIEKMMQETTMARLLSLPPSFFKKYSTGDLSARFASVLNLSNLVFNGVFLSLLSAIMSFAFMTQIVQFTPTLVIPVIAILGLNILSSAVIVLMQIKVSRKQLLLSAKESGTTYAIINGIQKIRLAGAEKRAFARWAKDFSKWAEPTYHPPLLIRLSMVISITITLLGEIAIYFIAAKSNVEVSAYVAFTSSFGSLSAMVATITGLIITLASVGPVLEMAKPILQEEPEDDVSKIRIEELHGEIKLENVTFKYEEDGPEILKNLSLDIKEGEYLGIVGKTGCGKSTLVRLLLGFEKPVEGNIYFDDKNINDLNLPSLRSNIGSVTQSGGVFHADIMSNILITAPQLKEEDAWVAAEIAGIAEDIRNMPMGMRTVISEGQGGISGGQRQRIMIARAIVNKPKILIFDEATSALDNKTQKSIAESISHLNCTRIVIAHRLSTIKNCDRIIYMEGGEIKESGDYNELIKKKGKFFELVERQRLDNE